MCSSGDGAKKVAFGSSGVSYVEVTLANAGIRYGIALLCLAVVVAAVVVSKRRDLAITGDASPAAARVGS